MSISATISMPIWIGLRATGTSQCVGPPDCATKPIEWLDGTGLTGESFFDNVTNSQDERCMTLNELGINGGSCAKAQSGLLCQYHETFGDTLLANADTLLEGKEELM